MIYEYNLKFNLLRVNEIFKYTVKQESFTEVKNLID